MSARLLGKVTVAGTLSALAAVGFWVLLLPTPGPEVASAPTGYSGVAWVAFAGSWLASWVFATRGALTTGWAVGFVVLCDLFAGLAFLVTALISSVYQAVMHTGPNVWANNSVAAHIFLTLLELMMGLTMGNVVTRGVGFIMALPALMWLWFTHRPPPATMAN